MKEKFDNIFAITILLVYLPLLILIIWLCLNVNQLFIFLVIPIITIYLLVLYIIGKKMQKKKVYYDTEDDLLDYNYEEYLDYLEGNDK